MKQSRPEGFYQEDNSLDKDNHGYVGQLYQNQAADVASMNAKMASGRQNKKPSYLRDYDQNPDDANDGEEADEDFDEESDEEAADDSDEEEYVHGRPTKTGGRGRGRGRGRGAGAKRGGKNQLVRDIQNM